MCCAYGHVCACVCVCVCVCVCMCVCVCVNLIQEPSGEPPCCDPIQTAEDSRCGVWLRPRMRISQCVIESSRLHVRNQIVWPAQGLRGLTPCNCLLSLRGSPASLPARLCRKHSGNRHVSCMADLMYGTCLLPSCCMTGMDFIAHLSKTEQDKLRRTIIELILGTDMKQVGPGFEPRRQQSWICHNLPSRLCPRIASITSTDRAKMLPALKLRASNGIKAVFCAFLCHAAHGHQRTVRSGSQPVIKSSGSHKPKQWSSAEHYTSFGTCTLHRGAKTAYPFTQYSHRGVR